MTHHFTEEQISAWLDAQVSPEDSRRIEDHLRMCGPCRALSQEISAVSELFRSVEELETPPGLWEKISASLEPAPKSAWSRFKLPVYRAEIWAAAAALILFLGAALLFREYRAEENARQIALKEIESVHQALTAMNPEIHNPFRKEPPADWSANPFSTVGPGEGFNPFQSSATR